MANKEGSFTFSKTIAFDHETNIAAKVFLDPFGSQLFVSVNEAGSAGIVKILDLSGRTLITKPLSGGKTAFDVSHLTACTYIAQLNDGSASQTFKVQKQQ